MRMTYMKDLSDFVSQSQLRKKIQIAVYIGMWVFLYILL